MQTAIATVCLSGSLDEKLEAIEWCGGVYSHEWGFAKLLHWLRHNPDKRANFATAFKRHFRELPSQVAKP